MLKAAVKCSENMLGQPPGVQDIIQTDLIPQTILIGFREKASWSYMLLLQPVSVIHVMEVIS